MELIEKELKEQELRLKKADVMMQYLNSLMAYKVIEQDKYSNMMQELGEHLLGIKIYKES